MKSLDNEKRLMIFTSVENMLKRKTIPVNENAMAPIQQAGNYLDYIVRGRFL